MPVAALRVCGGTGCRRLTAGRYCAACAPVDAAVGHRWGVDRREVKRVRGRRLQAQRAVLFAREPLCRTCAANGLVVMATIRDHVVPLAEGGADDDENVQPLCQSCSDVKTHEESTRGRRRADGAGGGR